MSDTDNINDPPQPYPTGAVQKGLNALESENYAEAEKYLRLAAQYGDTEAQYHLGWLYETVQFSYRQAIQWYRQAAVNNANAQYRLGCLALIGKGLQRDPQAAINWFKQAIPTLREAARADDIDAQTRLGWLYSQGLGVAKDLDAAWGWLQQAATQDYPDAHYQLGILHAGYKRDDQALLHFTHAAEQQHAHAQYKLGYYYQLGLGTTANAKQALHWYERCLTNPKLPENAPLRDKIWAHAQKLQQQRAISVHEFEHIETLCAPVLYFNDFIDETRLDFSEEFIHAYDCMESRRDSLFLTGKAGTGKSTLLDYFRQTTCKNIAVLAPTGVAALNVGGSTIHSFFRFPLHPLHPDDIRPVSRQRRRLYQALDTLVIDEISMVRCDLLDGIDRFMRLNGNAPSQPFGGVQVIMIGDLLQLPPVVRNEEMPLFSDIYPSPYFFSAHVVDDVQLPMLELHKIYRQTDAEFIQLLNAIRTNQVTPAVLGQLNQRYQPQFRPPAEQFYITLTTTNALANQINAARLQQLSPQQAHIFEAQVKGEFEERNAPTDVELALKIGAQVMFIKNDPKGRWVNGTLGKITSITQTSIHVQDEHGVPIEVEPTTWEMQKYQFDAAQQKVVAEVIGAFTQYPLRLAWAVTIHKSQGKTFDNVIIDLGTGTFAHGQLYVALSRCRSLAGLVLKTRVRAQDVIIDPKVAAFLREVKAL